MPFSYGLVMYGASGAGTDLPELIEKVTFSGATSGTSSTLSLSGYQLVEMHLHLSDAGDDNNVLLGIQLSADDGSTWESSDYAYTQRYTQSGSTSAFTERTTEASTGFYLTGNGAGEGIGATSPEGLFSIIRLQDPGNTTFWKHMHAESVYGQDDGATVNFTWMGGARTITTAINKIRVLNKTASPSNIAGTLYIYGYPSS